MCEAYLNKQSHAQFQEIDDVIGQSIPLVFNFTWPIFDENYRVPLESKILKQFWTREIGTETTGEFKLYLCNKLNKIMPYYNQLYKSALLEFNPLYDVDYQRTYKKTENETANDKDMINRNSKANGSLDSTVDNTNTTTNNLMTTNNGNNVESDTPQGLIQDVLDKKYATRVNQDMNTQNNTGTVSDDGNTVRTDSSSTTVTDTENNTRDRSRNTTDDYIETVTGKQGSSSYAGMLQEFRQTFLNIDAMILDELDELFFGLW